MLYSLYCSNYTNYYTIIADFSSIVNNIETISGNASWANAPLLIDSPASIAVNGSISPGTEESFSVEANFTYDSLR